MRTAREIAHEHCKEESAAGDWCAYSGKCLADRPHSYACDRLTAAIEERDRALTATGPGSGAAWVEFPGDGQLPAERRDVLVTIAAGEGGHQAAVAVGYLRHGSRGPFWVVTGLGRPVAVTHWCDCLGDGWRSPAWPNSAGQHGRGPVAAPQTDHRAAPATDTSKCDEKCSQREASEVGRGICPDCGGELAEGPHGGLSVNYYCARCGGGFNQMGPFGVDRITDRRGASK